MSFKVEVIKPRKGITLKFRQKTLGHRFYALEIYDQDDRCTVMPFKNSGSCITSTLLSRWANYHLYKELKSLAGLGSSVLYEGSGWKFREEVKYFGLHDKVNKTGNVTQVSIDDSIGMKNVVAILNGLGYNVETEYDSEENRMVQIYLIKEQ